MSVTLVRPVDHVGAPATGVQESPRKKSGRRCRIGAEAFVAGVRGAHERRPRGEGSRDHETGDLDHQLVDEITLLICPVVVGEGTRLFPATGQDIALDLVESRAFPKGITLLVYRPDERPQYATAEAV
jgi:hypothetical protein